MTQRDQDDAKLRAAFTELRDDEAARTPSFADVVARAARPDPRAFGGYRRLPLTAPLAIAAAFVMVAVGLYQTLSHRRQRLTVPKEVVALSAWRPATDVLLEASTQTLLIQTPQLSASTIDLTGDLP